MDIEHKSDVFLKLNSYAVFPDDDGIRYKEIIKRELLRCPELLYALNDDELEHHLFNEDGTLNKEGDWDLYFGDNIRPYMFFPESQTKAKNFLCYKIEFSEIPRYNRFEKIGNVTFFIMCDVKTILDFDTGIARHDLIASIIRERFNWSNIFGTQCRLVSNKETITDSNYVTRTLIFELTVPNSVLGTDNGTTRVINNVVNKGTLG